MKHQTKARRITYGIIQENYPCESGHRNAYGIVVYATKEDGSTPALIAMVRDLSSDRAIVEHLVDRCNRCKLSPIHLTDAAEDLLEENLQTEH